MFVTSNWFPNHVLYDSIKVIIFNNKHFAINKYIQTFIQNTFFVDLPLLVNAGKVHTFSENKWAKSLI